ncbi:hypothetical protein V8G54_032928, partial [Vigna mungo]
HCQSFLRPQHLLFGFLAPHHYYSGYSQPHFIHLLIVLITLIILKLFSNYHKIIYDYPRFVFSHRSFSRWCNDLPISCYYFNQVFCVSFVNSIRHILFFSSRPQLNHLIQSLDFFFKIK